MIKYKDMLDIVEDSLLDEISDYINLHDSLFENMLKNKAFLSIILWPPDSNKILSNYNISNYCGIKFIIYKKRTVDIVPLYKNEPITIYDNNSLPIHLPLLTTFRLVMMYHSHYITYDNKNIICDIDINNLIYLIINEYISIYNEIPVSKTIADKCEINFIFNNLFHSICNDFALTIIANTYSFGTLSIIKRFFYKDKIINPILKDKTPLKLPVYLMMKLCLEQDTNEPIVDINTK